MGGELFLPWGPSTAYPAQERTSTPPHPTGALPQDFARAYMTGHQAWPNSCSFEITISSYQESELTDLSLQTGYTTGLGPAFWAPSANVLMLTYPGTGPRLMGHQAGALRQGEEASRSPKEEVKGHWGSS